MKKMVFRIVAVSAAFLLTTGIASAQGSGSQDCTGDQTRLQDKTQVMDQAQQKDQDRLRLRNSLSEEQIAILENQEMTRSQKRKAFMASLTLEQKNMLRENQTLRQQQRNELCTGTASGKQEAKAYQYRGGNASENTVDAVKAQYRKGKR